MKGTSVARADLLVLAKRIRNGFDRQIVSFGFVLAGLFTALVQPLTQFKSVEPQRSSRLETAAVPTLSDGRRNGPCTRRR